MFSAPAQNTEVLIVALEHARVLSYLRVAPLALLVFDYCLTFGLEINYVWSRPWSAVSIVFMLTRYIPFVDTTMGMLVQVLSDLSEKECKEANIALTTILLAGMGAAEVLLTVRTWAVCGSKRWLAIALLLVGVAIYCGSVITVAQFLSSLTFVLQDSPLRPLLHGCFVTSAKPHMLEISWALLFVYDAINMGLMLVPAYRSLKNGSSSLTRAVISDGLIYYIYLFVVALANILVISCTTSDYSALIIGVGRVLHSIFACRVMLHAREEASQNRLVSSRSSVYYVDM